MIVFERRDHAICRIATTTPLNLGLRTMKIYAASSVTAHAEALRKRVNGMLTLAELGTASQSPEFVWYSRGQATLCVNSSGVIRYRDPESPAPHVTVINAMPMCDGDISLLWALRTVQKAYQLVTQAIETEPSEISVAGNDGLLERPHAAIYAAAALRKLTDPSMVLQCAYFDQPAYAYVHAEEIAELTLAPEVVDKLFEPVGQACAIYLKLLSEKVELVIGAAIYTEDFETDPVTTIRNISKCGLTEAQLTLQA
jgi:hypothetical protein